MAKGDTQRKTEQVQNASVFDVTAKPEKKNFAEKETRNRTFIIKKEIWKRTISDRNVSSMYQG